MNGRSRTVRSRLPRLSARRGSRFPRPETPLCPHRPDRLRGRDPGRTKKGDHVIFGARLASFQYDADNEEWVIGLEPKSGVSITSTKALETVGWPPPSVLDENDSDGEGP